ncbi:MAG: hypothetical protein V1663_00775 [archaeon]
MVQEIKGRIETVSLIERVRPGLFSGKVYGGDFNEVDVQVNMNGDIDKICNTEKWLVRFSLDQRGAKPIGNFITSRFDGDLSLNYDNYILLGMWEERMRVPERYPNLGEISNYYDPGDMSIVLYIKNTGRIESKKYLGVVITPTADYFRSFKFNFNFLIAHGIQNPDQQTLLQNPKRASRLIIMPPSDRIDDLEAKIRGLKVSPIRMEPKTQPLK